LLIRGGTSALGLAAIQLAKSINCTVLATTRCKEKLVFLKTYGVDIPLLDDGTMTEQLKSVFPKGVAKILELVGPATLLESMTFLAYHGIVCVTGMLGYKGTLENFNPIKDIRNGTYLCSFFSNYPTQSIIDKIFAHMRAQTLKPKIAKVFPFAEIAAAHGLMEKNTANGKIVVTLEKK
jgi:NADPH2:quinone reductase